MELKNTTDYPDFFLRRMIAWICKHPAIKLSVRDVGAAVFKNMSADAGENSSGRAYPKANGYYRNRFTVKITPVSAWENAPRRLRALVYVTAHELEHLNQSAEVLRGRYREAEARNWGRLVRDDFAAREAELTAAWMAPPSYATRSTAKSKSVVQKRQENAQKQLAKWTRKLKLAETKVKTWTRKVRYYEKKAADHGA